MHLVLHHQSFWLKSLFLYSLYVNMSKQLCVVNLIKKVYCIFFHTITIKIIASHFLIFRTV